MKKGMTYLLIVLFVCALMGCEGLPNVDNGCVDTPQSSPSQEVSGDPRTESGIGIYPGYTELAVGSTLKLYAYAVPDDPNADFTWETSDAGIAEVAQDGSVTAKAQGEVVVTASLRQSPDAKAACTVSVKQEGPTYLYNGPPSDPPEDPPDGPGKPGSDDGTGEGESGDGLGEIDGQGDLHDEGDIPIEYDDSIPVEVIPSIDEFIWTIKIDDIFDGQSTQGDFEQHALNRLQQLPW